MEDAGELFIDLDPDFDEPLEFFDFEDPDFGDLNNFLPFQPIQHVPNNYG